MPLIFFSIILYAHTEARELANICCFFSLSLFSYLYSSSLMQIIIQTKNEREKKNSYLYLYEMKY